MIAHMAPKRHELKTAPSAFCHVIDGTKTAEYRKDDRGFSVGDVLWLREWSQAFGYTGREATAVITHITRGPWVPEGFAMLSMGRVTVWFAAEGSAP